MPDYITTTEWGEVPREGRDLRSRTMLTLHENGTVQLAAMLHRPFVQTEWPLPVPPRRSIDLRSFLGRSAFLALSLFPERLRPGSASARSRAAGYASSRGSTGNAAGQR